ncbi:MAG: LysR family transcriptional regulator [Oscillospiraceae bacterium]|nr:LysR family transcriptional regulator [Oscillospiraceae bacterium]
MTVQQLRYFIAVAQYMHFGQAAKACYVSQPSLSHSIADLELELGVKLLYRGSRSVELTPAGKVFFVDAQDIVKRLDDAVIHAKRADSGYVGALNIGSLGGLSAGDFPAKIADFGRKYPTIDVTLTQTNMKTLNTCLLTGGLDVALTRELDIMQRSDELEWRELYEDRFGIVMRADHQLAQLEGLKPTDLADEAFVFLEPSVTPHVYNHTIKLCTSRGLVPNIAHTAPTLEIACTLIKSGMGVGILPECALAYSSGMLRFIPFEEDDALSRVVLAWRRKNVNPIVPLFLQEFGIDWG